MLCVLALLTLGVVMVNSAGMSVEPSQAVTVESILLSRSTVYMALAVVAMAACAMLPIRRLIPAAWLAPAGATPLDLNEDGLLVSGDFARRFLRTMLGLWPMWLLVGILLAVLATVYLPGIGRNVNGSSRWISLPAPGLESIQPSELAKWAMVAILAWYGAATMHRMHKFWRGLIPGLIAAGALAGFIVIEDLGTGVLLGCVACVMLIAAGAKVWQLALLAPAPLTLVALAIASSDYRRDRLLAFLDPYADPDGIGYHMIQSMVAVANGEVAGRGLGHGLQKFGYLPEDRTDFLFAIICEELGVAGALVVVALYAGMLLSCWSIIRREQAAMLKLLGLGVVATVGIQALINLAVVTGLGPTKGIALPLLSSGGTGWILTAASLGLIVAMDRTQDGWTAPAVNRAELPQPDSASAPVPADVTAEAAPAAPPVAPPINDDARWAPPGLFAAMTTPDVAEDPAAPSPSPLPESTESAVVDVQQGLLFVAQEEAPLDRAAPTLLDAEPAAPVSIADEPSVGAANESIAGTIIEPSGFDVAGGSGLLETIATADQPAEQVVIALHDAPAADTRSPVESADIGRHV